MKHQLTLKQLPARCVLLCLGLAVMALGVAFSIKASLLFLGGLEGIREGTVAAAVCVGLVTRQCQKPVKWVTKKLLPAG